MKQENQIRSDDRRSPVDCGGFFVPNFHAVSLSGGKDSTAMLLLMIERDMPVDCVISADTGMEFPEMYKDRRGTPNTFLTSFSFLLRRFCQDAGTYAGEEYEGIFPLLTREHLDLLHREIQSVHTSLDDLFHKIERKARHEAS